MLVDHGIPLEHIDNAFKNSAKFFDLPLETKQKTPYVTCPRLRIRLSRIN